MSKLATPALLLSALVVAGCGSSSSSTGSSASTPPAASTPSSAAETPTTSSAASAPAQAPASGSGQTQTLEANPSGALKYNKTSLTAKAGKVSIDFTNMAPEEHNMTIASASGAVVGATPTFQGGSKTLTLNLKSGTYKFFCTVPGHRAAGMEGTLTVQ